MAIEIARVSPDDPDAVGLIDELDAHLGPLYDAASRHGFSVARLLAQGVHFFVLRVDGAPAACGGILFVRPGLGDQATRPAAEPGAVAAPAAGPPDDPPYGELKRMYVRPAFRGTGLGRRMLDHLVAHAQGLGVTLLRLETGIHQQAAIHLYERAGFRRIAPFGPYFDDPVSRCYELRLA